MTDSLKIKIHGKCMELASEKMVNLQQLISDARAAGESDTKSSMGDKYETTREMMQIEINKLSVQMQEATKILLSLKILDPSKTLKTAIPGALIKTEKLWFYISAPLGKVIMDDMEIMAVSPASPIGKAMFGKGHGESFISGNLQGKILEIY